MYYHLEFKLCYLWTGFFQMCRDLFEHIILKNKNKTKQNKKIGIIKTHTHTHPHTHTHTPHPPHPTPTQIPPPTHTPVHPTTPTHPPTHTPRLTRTPHPHTRPTQNKKCEKGFVLFKNIFLKCLSLVTLGDFTIKTQALEGDSVSENRLNSHKIKCGR